MYSFELHKSKGYVKVHRASTELWIPNERWEKKTELKFLILEKKYNMVALNSSLIWEGTL